MRAGSGRRRAVRVNRQCRRADEPLAVECRRQDAGDGGLADAAVPTKDVAMRDAALLKRVLQSARDVVLPCDVGKALRPVFAGEYLVRHPSILPSARANGRCVTCVEQQG